MYLHRLIEAFFPPSPDVQCFRDHKDKLLTQSTLHHTDELLYLLPYHEPSTRALIHLIKFHHHRDAQDTLARIFIRLLPEDMQNHIFVPLPLSAKRYRERGYNQVTEVLRQARQKYPLPIDTHLLKRVRHTTPQTTLDRKERESNATGAFAVRPRANIAGRHIVLVDDVYTTGATMQAAKAALLPHHPASLTCLAFAH